MKPERKGMLTRWLPVDLKQPSSFANGKPINGEQWCRYEKKRLAEKGVKVRLVYDTSGSRGNVVGLEYEEAP